MFNNNKLSPINLFVKNKKMKTAILTVFRFTGHNKISMSAIAVSMSYCIDTADVTASNQERTQYVT